MDNPTGPEIAVALMGRAGPGASAAHVADASIATWHEIEADLAPIIGPRGVRALFNRSLHLALPAYPFLAAAAKGSQPTIDVAALQTVLANRTSKEAADASGVVLHTFHTLLAQLIGASLTERLLRSAWASFLSGEPTQDSMT